MLQKNIKKFCLVILTLLSSCACLFAEGKPATELAVKVKTEGLTGLNLFLANAYNDNRLLFAIVSTGSMIVLGIIITFIVSLILKPSGHTTKHE
jgi:hypothetical protein